jgi:hypothetical protein
MAWQQRSSGNRYASPSGHALFVGGHTRKPIAFIIKSKICSYCKSWKKKHGDELEPLPHICYANHQGSSGSMEPQACLDLTVFLYEKYKCVVELICADDDSSTRSLMKWSNADYMFNNKTTDAPTIPISKGPNQGKMRVRPDYGKLPREIPEPVFVADPNHRRKVFVGELIALDKAKVADKQTMTRMDSTRLGKNFSYMIRTLHKIPEGPDQDDKYIAAGKAVLEQHHFDNHEFCGIWCPRKRLTEEQRQASERYYRNKTTDAKLYKILSDKLSRFITVERLKEVAHGMDTQMNESFNNTASWFAPKNKVYCATSSLTNRISAAIALNNVGNEEYYRRLFIKLGIAMTNNVKHFLRSRETTRARRLEKAKTKEQKKERLKRKYAQLVSDTAIAKKERSKRDGTYKAGQNMQSDTGYADEDVGGNNNESNKRPKRATPTCRSCGNKGHATSRSKKCLNYNKAPTTATIIADQQSVNTALTDDDDFMEEECDGYDAEPLQPDPEQIDTEEDIEALNAFLCSSSSVDADVGVIVANI